jgi:hypothetical protein
MKIQGVDEPSKSVIDRKAQGLGYRAGNASDHSLRGVLSVWPREPARLDVHEDDAELAAAGDDGAIVSNDVAPFPTPQSACGPKATFPAVRRSAAARSGRSRLPDHLLSRTRLQRFLELQVHHRFFKESGDEVPPVAACG